METLTISNNADITVVPGRYLCFFYQLFTVILLGLLPEKMELQEPKYNSFFCQQVYKRIFNFIGLFHK